MVLPSSVPEDEQVASAICELNSKKIAVKDIQNKFCLVEGRCATGIQELQQKGYLGPSLNDDSIGYVQLNKQKDCVVQTTLSTNEVYSIKCFPVKSP